MLPNNRDEIPTPAAAHAHRHLGDIARKIPPLDKNAEILLLLGRDILSVHKVRSLINGPQDAMVIIGDVCLGSTHRPSEVNTFNLSALAHFGPAKQLHSDSGTNFIGAQREVEENASEKGKIQGYLQNRLPVETRFKFTCTLFTTKPSSSSNNVLGGLTGS